MATTASTPRNRQLSLAYRRVVVKAGTNVLTSKGTRLDRSAMAGLADQIAEIRAAGAEVILVTSGAVAAGREVMGKAADVSGVGLSQMLAAVGQSRLMHAYQELFSQHNVVVAQALLTHQDVEGRLGYLNVRNTFENLMANGVVPIVNENDVVNTEELSQERFGDNDKLSALVANIVDADLLLILSDVGGLYTADPNRDPSATLVERVEVVDADILGLAETHRSKTSRGGMGSKLMAARVATAAGVTVVIASGHEAGTVTTVVSGGKTGTVFAPTASHVESRKRWLLSGVAERGGVVVVDEGAVTALRGKAKSLLPAGIREVKGAFDRGDVIGVEEANGKRIAVGVTNYSSEELRAIQGVKSSNILGKLGHTFGDEAIHRNNMAVL